MSRISALAALAAPVLALAITPVAFGQVQDQQGWPFQGNAEGSSSYSYPTYFTSTPVTTVSPAPTEGVSDTSFISIEAPRDDTALINVRMPAGAQLFFNNVKVTDQARSERLFQTAPLDPGSAYRYELRARWMRNGQWIEKTRVVNFHADDVVNVDFNRGG